MSSKIQASIDRMNKDAKSLISLLKKQGEEIKSYGATSKSTADKIKEIEASIDEHEAKLATVGARMDGISVKMNRGNLSMLGSPQHRAPSSLFDSLLDKKFFDTVKSHGKAIMDMDEPVSKAAMAMLTRKAEWSAVGSDSTAALDTVVGTRFSEIVHRPERQFNVLDAFPVAAVNDNTIYYVEESEFYHLSMKLTVGVSSSGKILTVDNSQGAFKGQTVTVVAGSTVRNGQVESVNHATNQITLVSALGVAFSAYTASNPVYVTSKEIGPVANGELKPNAHVRYENKSVNVVTIPHGMPLHKQVLDDYNLIKPHIDRRLMEGLRRAVEHQVLYGLGPAENQLEGIFSHPKVQRYEWSTDGVHGDTEIDALRRMMTLAQLYHYEVNRIMLSPSMWERIELLKGSDKHYVWVVVTEGGALRLWRVPITVSTALNTNDVAIGAFDMATQLWDRQKMSMEMSNSHTDHFMRNMVQLLAELRVGFSIFRPEAIITGDLTSPPSAPSS